MVKENMGFSKELVKEAKEALDVVRKKINVGKKQEKKQKGIHLSRFPTLQIVDEKEIAMDFAAKLYQKFDKIIKSVVLFGSSAKNTSTATSDIDIVIIVDDASVQWDQELVAWYREELGKLIRANPYKKELHINSIKLTIWYQDMIQGDPVVLNIIRYGETLIDLGGFFTPLKVLLQQGRIKPTPEAIYNALERAPQHLSRSRASQLSAIEGIYWAFVDSSHAALISARKLPPSPEHIPIILKETFVDKRKLDMKYVIWYRDIYSLHRRIIHREINFMKGAEIDEWHEKANLFIQMMTKLIRDSIG